MMNEGGTVVFGDALAWLRGHLCGTPASTRPAPVRVYVGGCGECAGPSSGHPLAVGCEGRLDVGFFKDFGRGTALKTLCMSRGTSSSVLSRRLRLHGCAAC